MSSSQVFARGHGASRQANRWQLEDDGALATTLSKSTDDVKVAWDLTYYLASAETVSSAAYADSGAVTSSKSVATPQVLFTITGIGETEVQATLSTGRVVTQVWRTYAATGTRSRDYR